MPFTIHTIGKRHERDCATGIQVMCRLASLWNVCVCERSMCRSTKYMAKQMTRAAHIWCRCADETMLNWLAIDWRNYFRFLNSIKMDFALREEIDKNWKKLFFVEIWFPLSVYRLCAGGAFVMQLIFNLFRFHMNGVPCTSTRHICNFLSERCRVLRYFRCVAIVTWCARHVR